MHFSCTSWCEIPGKFSENYSDDPYYLFPKNPVLQFVLGFIRFEANCCGLQLDTIAENICTKEDHYHRYIFNKTKAGGNFLEFMVLKQWSWPNYSHITTYSSATSRLILEINVSKHVFCPD